MTNLVMIDCASHEYRVLHAHEVFFWLNETAKLEYKMRNRHKQEYPVMLLTIKSSEHLFSRFKAVDILIPSR